MEAEKDNLVTYESFHIWFWRLDKLARNAGFKLGKKEEYREYYDDGDSPEHALECEMEHCSLKSLRN